MAKIVYFSSVINSEEKQELEKSGISILDATKEFGIEKHSLSIELNGETPDDIDPEYILKDEDSLIIRKVVHGNDAQSKRTLATVVQIAAIVGALFIDPTGSTSLAILKAGIVIGGSIASGALLARAAALEAATLKGGANVGEIDVATNSYSQTNISNEARPLQPVPIVMGSHRTVPDFYARPYNWLFNDSNTISELAPIVFEINTGLQMIGGNGPTAPNNSWITVPAGYVHNNPPTFGDQYDRFPQYEIKISPYYFGIKIGELTPEKEQEARDLFKSMILNAWNAAGGPENYSSSIGFPSYIGVSGNTEPLVIYHSTIGDPYFNRFNLLWIAARAYELNRARVALFPTIIPTDYNYYSDLTNFFNGTYDQYVSGAQVYSYEQRFFRGGNNVLGESDVPVGFSIPKDLIKSGTLSGYYYPSNVNVSDNINSLMSKFGTLLYNLNFNNYTPALPFRNDAPMIEVHYIPFGISSVVNEGISYSTQAFSYGLGDLEITDRRVGSSEVGLSGSISAYSEINKDNWKIPDITSGLPFTPAKFYTNVYNGDQKKLSNINSLTTFVQVWDNRQHNFVYYEGAINQPIMYFVVSGRIYATSTSTGFASNSTQIEVQWKRTSDTVWTPLGGSGIFVIQNNNSKLVNFKTSVGSEADGFLPEGERLTVRIRKVTLDSTNNDTNKICDISVVKISFLSIDSDQEIIERHRPLNVEGLFMTALLADVAQTDKYSAMVESKCWYYDFDTEEWVWGKTRNPAFWFLFFAHGGYETNEQDNVGERVYPYSPTKGWVNYPNHPDSIRHLFGAGYTDEMLDMDQILNWAQFCEDNNLRFDMVLKDDTSCADILERIANCGRASVTQYNSLLSVVYEDQNQAATCMFGMGNIKAGSFSVNYAVADPIRTVYANYVDRTDWETKQVEAIVPFSDPENLLSITINLEGVTEYQQAQRECNLLAARQFFQRRTYSWEVDIEGLLVKRGNLVYISHDSTQYGVSGRVSKFLTNDSGDVIGLRTSAILNESIEYVTVRDPLGEMEIYACHADGENIIFDEAYPLEKAPFYINNTTENNTSEFNESIPEDFVIIAGEQETGGKIVRISTIESSDDYSFKISAVDEDPAMWAYEYNDVSPEDIESFDDSEVELIVENVSVEYFENGRTKIMWNGKNADLVQIINLDNNLPVVSDGSYTFSNGEAIVTLTSGHKFNLEIRPFAIGTPYKSVSKKVIVWPT